MNAFEYAEAMARVKALPCGERYPAWRAAKTARALYLLRKRRAADPQWWKDRLARYAERRRERARTDPVYRERRNAQNRGRRCSQS